MANQDITLQQMSSFGSIRMRFSFLFLTINKPTRDASQGDILNDYAPWSSDHMAEGWIQQAPRHMKNWMKCPFKKTSVIFLHPKQKNDHIDDHHT